MQYVKIYKATFLIRFINVESHVEEDFGIRDVKLALFTTTECVISLS
jgi:hypothetical protein